MLKKSAFYDFLDRRDNADFESFYANSTEDSDYIDWNGFLLPMHYGDAQLEYFAIRKSRAICDVSPMRKIRVRGDNAGRFFNHSPYFESVCDRFDIEDVEFTECTSAWIGVAIQGPLAAAVPAEAGFIDVALSRGPHIVLERRNEVPARTTPSQVEFRRAVCLVAETPTGLYS